MLKARPGAVIRALTRGFVRRCMDVPVLPHINDDSPLPYEVVCSVFHQMRDIYPDLVVSGKDIMTIDTYGDLVRYLRNRVEGPFEVVFIKHEGCEEKIEHVYSDIADAEWYVHESSSVAEAGPDFHEYAHYEVRSVTEVTHFAQLPSDERAICGVPLIAMNPTGSCFLATDAEATAEQGAVTCPDCRKKMLDCMLISEEEYRA